MCLFEGVYLYLSHIQVCNKWLFTQLIYPDDYTYIIISNFIIRKN